MKKQKITVAKQLSMDILIYLFDTMVGGNEAVQNEGIALFQTKKMFCELRRKG